MFTVTDVWMGMKNDLEKLNYEVVSRLKKKQVGKVHKLKEHVLSNEFS